MLAFFSPLNDFIFDNWCEIIGLEKKSLFFCSFRFLFNFVQLKEKFLSFFLLSLFLVLLLA